MPPLSLPQPSPQHGYSCKTWIARELEERHLGGRHHVWFCTELNPLHNGDSSNPAWLYLTIDRAVKYGDRNHPKIRELRRKLLRVVSRLLQPKDRGLARELKRTITRAPLDLFRPQLWRLDLVSISPYRVSKEGATAGWDEQYVADLRREEFEVIVD